MSLIRLLQRKPNGEIVFHEPTSGDVPAYVILSYTWGKEEVVFQDIQVGVDMSKTNAARCYVYLSDIFKPDTRVDDQRAWGEAFRKSHWFTRGWTLQELIAPRLVDFFSSEGVDFEQFAIRLNLALFPEATQFEKYTAIFWLNANNEDSLKLSFRDVAQQVLRYHPSINLDYIINRVKGWLDSPQNARQGIRIHVQKLLDIREGFEIMFNILGRKGIKKALVKELDGLLLALSIARIVFVFNKEWDKSLIRLALTCAKAMYTRALEGKEKALGLDHTLTLFTVYSLSIFYNNQGKLVKAEAMYTRALKGKEKALGPELASSYLPALNIMFAFGDLFSQTDRNDMARTMYSRALSGYTTV
ncbi:hypothetical protein BKA65DRAFT_604320 [Rhexocercosporidium sp. MPI-PUGE-AT-0058]|nr:hypothetical protein BKA65DRAFT_604320 [Rhexocercosporidium sp. MPI-PUGE-AT-0058]